MHPLRSDLGVTMPSLRPIERIAAREAPTASLRGTQARFE
jgi:hypothetical protein